MKFLGKMCLMIMLKVIKSRALFSICLFSVSVCALSLTPSLSLRLSLSLSLENKKT